MMDTDTMGLVGLLDTLWPDNDKDTFPVIAVLPYPKRQVSSMLHHDGKQHASEIWSEEILAIGANEPINGYVLSWSTEIKCVVVR